MSTEVPARMRKGTDQTWGWEKNRREKGQGNPEERVPFEFGESATESKLQLHTPFVQRVAHHVTHQSSRPFIDTTLQPPPPHVLTHPSCHAASRGCGVASPPASVDAGGRGRPPPPGSQRCQERVHTYVLPRQQTAPLLRFLFLKFFSSGLTSHWCRDDIAPSKRNTITPCTCKCQLQIPFYLGIEWHNGLSLFCPDKKGREGRSALMTFPDPRSECSTYVRSLFDPPPRWLRKVLPPPPKRAKTRTEIAKSKNLRWSGPITSADTTLVIASYDYLLPKSWHRALPQICSP